MRKTITARQILHGSYLGDGVFQNVPVSVEASVEETTFDPTKDDYALSGDVIDLMEREVAKRWLQTYRQLDEDGNHVRRVLLTQDEFYGVMIILGLTGTELAKVLGTTKGTISRILKGTRFASPMMTAFMTLLLADEIKRPGHARRLLKKSAALESRALEPQWDLGRKHG